MWGVLSNANVIYLVLMIFPHMSLHCMLVPVQYREYENGPLLSHPGGGGSYQYSSSLYIVHACITDLFFSDSTGTPWGTSKAPWLVCGVGWDSGRCRANQVFGGRVGEVSLLSLCPSGALSSKRLLQQGHGFYSHRLNFKLVQGIPWV